MFLHIKAIKAKDVPKLDIITHSDPYLVFKLNSNPQTWKTDHKTNVSEPIWNQEFLLPLSKDLNDMLTIKLYDKDLTFDDLISTIQINVKEIPIGKEFKNWYYFNPANGVKSGGQVQLIIKIDDSNCEIFGD
ncbi:Protein Aster-C [Tritrichomonas musculus]|uniref:Protein Aster-C n=1 Tax=Tritrichomonas musculus TaxID=1915356 RepID=A0ABR2H746_9EUKA